MIALVVFSEIEPMIVITTLAVASDERLAERLRSKGVEKFIAREIPLDKLRDRYGLPFEVLEAEVDGGKDLRVLDYNGRHIFENISLADLGAGLRYEPESATAV
jgi:hypothetical protein